MKTELSKDNYCKNYNNWCEKEKRTCNNCYYERGYNMSDEEKNAFQYYKECNKKDLENYEYLHEVSQKQAKYLEILLNLIEKQSKEIEELKEEKAKRQWVHIKENGEVEPLFYVSKDKIKAKIKEIEKYKNLKIEVEYVKIKMYSIKIGTKTIFYEWKDNLTFSANIESIKCYIDLIIGGRQ